MKRTGKASDTVIHCTVKPEIKLMAKALAEKQDRDITSLVQHLIRKEFEASGLSIGKPKQDD